MAEAPPLRDEPSDGDLARRIARLDPGEARREEAELFARFSRRVYLFGMRHLRDPDGAADLVQDVMGKVIERLRAGEVREPQRIGSFVLGTARVMMHDRRRRHRRQREVGDRMAREAERSVRPVEPLDTDRLTECLERLPERERTVVLLSFVSEQAAPEIGAALGLSPGNVRVLRHRAVSRLQGCMGLGEGDAS